MMTSLGRMADPPEYKTRSFWRGPAKPTKIMEESGVSLLGGEVAGAGIASSIEN